MATTAQKTAQLTTSQSYVEAPVVASVIPQPHHQSHQLPKPLNRNPALSFQAHSGVRLLDDQREHKWTNHSWDNQNSIRFDKWEVVPHEPRPHPDPLRKVNVATWTWRGEGQEPNPAEIDPNLHKITGGRDGKDMNPLPPFDWRKTFFKQHLAECALCREMVATRGWPAQAPECFTCPCIHSTSCGPQNTICGSRVSSWKGPNLKNTGAGAISALNQFYSQKGTITTEEGGYGRIGGTDAQGKPIQSNETNVDNPLFQSGNVALYDQYKKENEEALKREQERGTALGREKKGEVMQGMWTTPFNPILMPNRVDIQLACMKAAEEGKPKVSKKPKMEFGPNGKVKPTYDSSDNNPFNTLDRAGFEHWRAENAKFMSQFAPNQREGSLGPDNQFSRGNQFSRDNPMRFSPLGLNTQKYGEVQPIFDPPRRADQGKDRRVMESDARGYTYTNTSVDLTKSRIPAEPVN